MFPTIGNKKVHISHIKSLTNELINLNKKTTEIKKHILTELFAEFLHDNKNELSSKITNETFICDSFNFEPQNVNLENCISRTYNLSVTYIGETLVITFQIHNEFMNDIYLKSSIININNKILYLDAEWHGTYYKESFCECCDECKCDDSITNKHINKLQKNPSLIEFFGQLQSTIREF